MEKQRAEIPPNPNTAGLPLTRAHAASHTLQSGGLLIQRNYHIKNHQVFVSSFDFVFRKLLENEESHRKILDGAAFLMRTNPELLFIRDCSNTP